jgi:hypothetical protein
MAGIARKKKERGIFAATYLAKEDFDELKRRAKKEGRSASGQIRYCVLKCLEEANCQ